MSKHGCCDKPTTTVVWTKWEDQQPTPDQRTIVQFKNLVTGRTWTQGGAVVHGQFWYDDVPVQWCLWPEPPPDEPDGDKDG